MRNFGFNVFPVDTAVTVLCIAATVTVWCSGVCIPLTAVRVCLNAAVRRSLAPRRVRQAPSELRTQPRLACTVARSGTSAMGSLHVKSTFLESASVAVFFSHTWTQRRRRWPKGGAFWRVSSVHCQARVVSGHAFACPIVTCSGRGWRRIQLRPGIASAIPTCTVRRSAAHLQQRTTVQCCRNIVRQLARQQQRPT